MTPTETAPEGEDLYTAAVNTTIVGIEDGGTYAVAPTGLEVECVQENYGWTLTEGTDYTIEYYDAQGTKLESAPTAKGTYSLKVVGNNKTAWGESQAFAFTIDPDISAADVEIVDEDVYTYNGTSQAPEVSVSYNGKEFTEGDQYEIQYTNAYGTYSNAEAPTMPGAYTLTVSTKAPYEGGVLATKDFVIKAVDITKGSLTAGNVAYTGSAVTPEITLKDSEGNVVNPSLVAVTYKDASGADVAASDLVNEGTYTAVATGAGLNGTQSATFQIVAADKVLGTTATCTNADDLVYTGAALTPVFTLVDQGGNEVTAALHVTYKNATTGAEVAAADLIAAGDYTATITTEGYAGQATCDFTIKTQAVTDAQVTLNRTDYEYIPSVYWQDPAKGVPSGEAPVYRGEEIMPDVTVTLDGKTLIEGTDYTIEADNNTGLSTDAAGTTTVATFKVVLQGEYSGTLTSDAYTYNIVKNARTYEYEGVKFSYAVDADGFAVITGLATDKPSDSYTAAWDGETVTVPDTIVEGEKTYQVKRVAERAFNVDYYQGASEGDKLNGAKKLVIQAGIEEIGQNAFSCSNLEELVLNEGLKVIHPYGFSGAMSNVKEIKIPASVERLGSAAFGQNLDYSGVTSIEFAEGSKLTDISEKAVSSSSFSEGEQMVSYQVLPYNIPGVGSKGDLIMAGYSPFDGGGYPSTETKGYSSVTELKVPASYTSMGQLYTDFGNLTNLYYMADRYDNLSSVSALCYCGHKMEGVTTTLWGWDDASMDIAQIASTLSSVDGYKPFAVFGEGYTYEDATDGATTYAGNVSVGTPEVTNDGSAVTVDWNLQTNYKHAAAECQWTPVEGTDFTVSYVDAQGNPVETITEAGTYTATLTGNGKTCFGTQDVQVVVDGIAITDSCVSASGEGLTYNGTAQDATSVKVTVDGALLEEGTDYTVAYTNNVNAGTATATVTGKGLYAGTATATYEIAQAPLTVTADSATKTAGDAEPTLGYTVEGLVGGDVLASAKVAREAGETAGDYAVKASDAIVLNEAGTTVETSNYAVTYVDGTLTIEKVPATGVEGFVERLYDNVMGRTASDEEIDFQVDGLKAMGAAQIVYNFYNSDEFKAKAATMTNEEIVENVYQTMLGRTADEEGMAMWVSYLDNGMSACALVAGFAESEEFAGVCAGYGIGTGSANQLRSMLEPRDRNAGVTAFASRMYTVVLSRDAEIDGLNVQCQALIDGTPCYQIAYNFFNSKEFADKGYTSEQIVRIAYAALLGRDQAAIDADADGIAYWVERLEKNGLEDVIKGFCQSDEFEKICQDCGMTSGMR